MHGLYIHIPFCEGGKCPYCDFFSEPLHRNEDYAFHYGEAVIRNLEFYNERFDTLYFGGGTPALVWEEVCRIMGSVRVETVADIPPEVTVEANPKSVSARTLIALRDSGVNRLSFGVHSMSNSELKTLGRRHTSDDSVTAIKLARELGFRNISADLMIGIPRQTPGNVKNSIKNLAALPVSHVSLYILKLEKDTPFFDANIKLPGDDETAELYLTAAELLEKLGFFQYEISNFSRPGFECRHNLKYWHGEEYLGIGAGAHSFYKGKRFEVTKNIKKFIKDTVQEEIMINYEPQSFTDYAMLKLRLTTGISFDECAKFGVSKGEMMERCQRVPPDMVSITSERISMTKKGFLVSNEIITQLTNVV